jgi:hypothetical protein
MTEWEYVIVDEYKSGGSPIYAWTFENLGRQGFELVSVLPYENGLGKYIFKRPKPKCKDSKTLAFVHLIRSIFGTSTNRTDLIR